MTGDVTHRTAGRLWRWIFSVVLCLVLASPRRASASEKIGYNGPIVGPIVGALAAVVVVTIVVVYEVRKKRAITGCTASGEGGIVLTDEKDRHAYLLSGNIAAIKPGERMILRGKRIKPNGGQSLGWEIKEIKQDLGLCRQ
jgi:hypothetical protein